MGRFVLTLFMVVSMPCRGDVGANGLVILLSDYGADSIYVGALKGSIYSKNPEARIDTITNSVPPFDIGTGAYMLAEICAEYPRGTTFCCVVDPGVGSARKCIVLKTKTGQFFVGPDNGLLSLVAQRYGVADLRESTNSDLWRMGNLSHTFHGRDIFGPVSGSVARGVSMDDVGPKIKDLIQIDFDKSEIVDGEVRGAVIRNDPYGNLITNIKPEDLTALGMTLHDSVKITIGKTTYEAPVKNTYGDVAKGERLVLVQSMGFVECAINMGSLSKVIGEGLHAPVRMRKAK